MESKHPKDDEQVEGVKPEPYDRMQNIPFDAGHVVPPPRVYGVAIITFGESMPKHDGIGTIIRIKPIRGSTDYPNRQVRERAVRTFHRCQRLESRIQRPHYRRRDAVGDPA